MNDRNDTEVGGFPTDDNEFEEYMITDVSRCDDGGWDIWCDEGGMLYPLDEPSPITPAVGMTARFYGKGPGFPYRGLFLNGTRIFYRTRAEGALELQARLRMLS